MVYVKHSELGNKHVSDEEAKKLVNEGWVRWPRTKEQKEAKPVASVSKEQTLLIAVETADQQQSTSLGRNRLSLNRAK